MKTFEKILFVGILGSSGLASANAFNVNEHDAAATGRAGATAATNTGASSVIFNPGGMALGEGTSITVGATVYAAEGNYQPAGGDKVTTDQDPAIAPSFFLAAKLHKAVAVGIGFHLPFGLAMSWPANHPQQDVIQDQALRTYYITPAIGFNLGGGFAIGGGLDIVPATVKLERSVTFGDAEGTAVLGGKATGIGGRVGVMFNPDKLKEFHLGVMWRSAVKLDFKGTGDFDIAAPYRSQLPPDGDITTSIKLPQAVWGGIAFDASPNLQLEYDLVWQEWSSFKELKINLPGDTSTTTAENYRDTVTHRLGIEYKWPTAALRAGFIYDPTPIPSTTLSAQLPDVDRKDITVGASKMFGDFGVHLGFLWVTPDERDTNMTNPYTPQYKATYGVQAFVGSLSISGTFGGKKAEPMGAASTSVSSR